MDDNFNISKLETRQRKQKKAFRKNGRQENHPLVLSFLSLLSPSVTSFRREHGRQEINASIPINHFFLLFLLLVSISFDLQSNDNPNAMDFFLHSWDFLLSVVSIHIYSIVTGRQLFIGFLLLLS